MTFLVERLAELQKYLQHAEEIRARGIDRAKLASDLTLRNDVLFTLLTIAQLVIDIAGELAARRGERFAFYREAIGSLRHVPQFPPALAERLERLAGFRNVVVHEYVGIDDVKVLAALDDLAPVAELVEIVRKLETLPPSS